MMEMGNSRGRAVYEANIPDGFRRPQTDSYAFLFQQCHSSNDENFNIFLHEIQTFIRFALHF